MIILRHRNVAVHWHVCRCTCARLQVHCTPELRGFGRLNNQSLAFVRQSLSTQIICYVWTSMLSFHTKLMPLSGKNPFKGPFAHQKPHKVCSCGGPSTICAMKLAKR